MHPLHTDTLHAALVKPPRVTSPSQPFTPHPSFFTFACACTFTLTLPPAVDRALPWVYEAAVLLEPATSTTAPSPTTKAPAHASMAECAHCQP